MTTEICIEHRYPAAYAFVEQHGPDAIAVIHDLITHAEQLGDQLVVQASVRQIAQRLPRLSKDTVYRRLRQLHRAHVIRTGVDQGDRPIRPPDLCARSDGHRHLRDAIPILVDLTSSPLTMTDSTTPPLSQIRTDECTPASGWRQ